MLGLKLGSNKQNHTMSMYYAVWLFSFVPYAESLTILFSDNFGRFLLSYFKGRKPELHDAKFPVIMQ